MQFCLTKDKVRNFIGALKSGKIDPEKVSKMTSEERRTFFEDIVGKDNAKDVNALFESKLLLKNQQAGMITWAKQVAGMTKRARRDVISRIERMDAVLNPAEEKAFLSDLAASKLGATVSYEEAQKISELSKAVEANKDKAGNEDLETRLEYGRPVIELKNYVGDLTKDAKKVRFADIKNQPFKMAGKALVEAAGNAKAIQASMDNSAVFRQGWKTMWTHPTIWAKNGLKSFQHLVTLFGQDKVMNELNADIVSRPTFPLMEKAKLDIGATEEAYPTTLPEKVPVLGRIYKATENAYTAFVRKTRADVFDKYIDIANRTGVELDDAQLKSIGKMVNSLTGRGSLGALEPAAKVINNVFFSPKFLKSHIDLLTQPITGAGGSAFVRKQAAINLVKVIGGTAAVMALANAVKPGSVELDPRSSDFGKIKVGNTRFDITGGMGSLATLAARLATGMSKSSTIGKVSDLNNPKYGGANKVDVVTNFFENKLSPAGNFIKDFLKGKDFEGNPTTLQGEALKMVTPLPVANAIELWKDPTASNQLRITAMLADAMGIATNTYGVKATDVNPNAVSPAAKEAQLRQAKAVDLMDQIDQAKAQGKDTKDLETALQDKLDTKDEKGTITKTEAERANKILGTKYEGQKDDPPPPEVNRKYGKNAEGLIDKIATWAQALGTDPVDAFEKFTQGERIARLENGTIIVQRMDESQSGAMRKKLGGGGKEVKLDHIKPLEIGGTNDPSNLRLVTTEEWQSFSPVEDYLGQALHAGKVSGKDAQDWIVKFKDQPANSPQADKVKRMMIKAVGLPFNGTAAPEP